MTIHRWDVFWKKFGRGQRAGRNWEATIALHSGLNNRIVLASLNSAWYQSNLALYSLREALRGLPWRASVLEFTLSEQLPDILAELYKRNASIYGFSAYIWNRECLQAVIPGLKKLRPKARIVLGGPEALQGGFGLSADDYLIKGPGEGEFRRLAESGFSLPGGLYAGPAPQQRDLPFPYRTTDKPALQNKLVYYESSRGCPFRCAYCLSASDDRNEARFDPTLSQDRKRLYRELDRLLDLEPRTLKFVDRSFNLHPGLARLIWQYAIKRGQACEFHFEIYPGLLAEEDISLLEQAPENRFRFEVGIQTIDPEVARLCGRVSDWPKEKAMLTALRERTRICLHTDLLAGLPGENYASVLLSLDELAPLFPHEIQLGMLKILPDTPMVEIARRRGYLWMDRPPYQILTTDALSFPEVAKLQSLARIINLYWNKGEFTDEWGLLLASGRPASSCFLQLLETHTRLGLPLHSISRQQRGEIFNQTLNH